jgi:hypothetical protein
MIDIILDSFFYLFVGGFGGKINIGDPILHRFVWGRIFKSIQYQEGISCGYPHPTGTFTMPTHCVVEG